MRVSSRLGIYNIYVDIHMSRKIRGPGATCGGVMRRQGFHAEMSIRVLN